MVSEVEKVLQQDVPRVHGIGDESCVAALTGSISWPVARRSTLRKRRSILRIVIPIYRFTAMSGWEFCDNTPHRLDNRCAVIGVSDYGKTEEVIKALELGRACGALTAAFTKKPDSPITVPVEYVVDYQGRLHLGNPSAALLQRGTGDGDPPRAACGNRQNQTDLQKLPQALGYLVRNWEEKGRQFGEQASSWPMIYTVSAGPLRPLGYKEGIVTLMEFTWTHGSVIESGDSATARLKWWSLAFPSCSCSAMTKSRHTTERAIRFVKERTDNVIVIDYADIAQGLHPWLAPFLMFVRWSGSATTCRFTKITTRMIVAITAALWSIDFAIRPDRAGFP